MQVQHWMIAMGSELVGTSWDELRHIRHAVAFLVLRNKRKTSETIQTEVCPQLSMQQVQRISVLYRDNKYDTPKYNNGYSSEDKIEHASSHCCSSPAYFFDTFDSEYDADSEYEMTKYDIETETCTGRVLQEMPAFVQARPCFRCIGTAGDVKAISVPRRTSFFCCCGLH